MSGGLAASIAERPVKKPKAVERAMMMRERLLTACPPKRSSLRPRSGWRGRAGGAGEDQAGRSPALRSAESPNSAYALWSSPLASLGPLQASRLGGRKREEGSSSHRHLAHFGAGEDAGGVHVFDDAGGHGE